MKTRILLLVTGLSLLTVTLDFGNQFPGADRWLEIGVHTNGGGAFSTLTPRQKLAPTPYAITAGNVAPGAGLSGTYGSAVSLNNSANQFTGSFTGNGSNVTNVNAITLGGLGANQFWKITGNSNTVAGMNFIGTTDNQPLELRVNGARVLRMEPTANDVFHSNIVNVIGGSSANYVSNGVVGATISGGGARNYTGSGYTNAVTGDFGTVGGGLNNSSDYGSTVGGGFNNQAKDPYATVAGGYVNTASGLDAMVGGWHGNTASGQGATVPGGFDNTAAGSQSFAAGTQAKAMHDGSFVWADNQFVDFASTAPNQFLIRASGGVGIGLADPASPLHVSSAGNNPQMRLTQTSAADFARLRMNVAGSPFWEMDVSSGVAPSISWWNVSQLMALDYNGNLTTSGTVNGTSDRNAKEKFTAVSSRAVLDKVAALPISEWNFKNESAIRHIGPMAQDFYAAFSVGMDDKHIATVDEGGVALAAIQGLNQKMEEQVRERDVRITALENELAEIKHLLTKLSSKGN